MNSFAAIKNVLKRRGYWMKALGAFFGILGVALTASEFVQNFFPNFELKPWYLLPVAAVIALIALIYVWPRKMSFKMGRRSNIELVVGDLLTAIDDPSTDVVVGTSRTFVTDPRSISKTSIQGQVTERFFNSAESLDQKIQKSIDKRRSIGTCDESEVGVYAPGTIALAEPEKGDVKHSEATRVGESNKFIFLAYTQQLSEGTDFLAAIDDVWVALSELWKFARRQRDTTIAMPVIATANAGLDKVMSTEDAIRLIVLSYVLNERSHAGGLPPLQIYILQESFDELNRVQIEDYIDAFSV